MAKNAKPKTKDGSQPFITRIATFNVLGWHHSQPGGKNERMANGVNRMVRTLALWTRLRLSLVLLQETETPQRRVVRRSGLWRVVEAEVNSPLPHGNSMRNAIAIRRATWKVIDTANIKVPISGSGHGNGLNMPAVLLRHRRRKNVLLAALCLHNPSNGKISGGTDKDRATCVRYEAAWAAACIVQGIPVVLGGDGNATNAAEELVHAIRLNLAGHLDARVRILAEQRIDLLIGHEVRGLSDFVVEGTNGTLSDHPLVGAKVSIPVMDEPVGHMAATRGRG